MFLFMFLFIFLFMTFYQCFFIMFLNKCIGKISIIYYVLFHSISRRTHWENSYHLLCAFSFYFSIFFENMHELNSLLLGKPLSFTMCFPILFPGERTGETPIIYYVLSHRVHSIPRRAHCHWGNPYYLLCASPFYSPTDALGKPLSFTMCFLIGFILFPDGRIAIGETPIIYYVLLHPILRRARFSLKTRMGPTRSYWGNPYYLLCASPLDRVIGEISIIYYVLPHPILRRAPWGNPYHLLCASPSYFSIFFENTHGPNSLLLGKPLSFTMCFPILFSGGRLGDTPIIYYVRPHRVLRRAHCHWGNLYYLVGASPVIDMFEAWHRPWSWSMPSHSSRHWGNLYYLVGASPSYSPTSALGKGSPNWWRLPNYTAVRADHCF